MSAASFTCTARRRAKRSSLNCPRSAVTRSSTRTGSARTESTITDRDELLEELAEVREQGYAVNREENVVGYRSIATVITYPDGPIFGGLVAGGPSDILNDGINQSMYDPLFETTDRIESGLATVR